MPGGKSISYDLARTRLLGYLEESEFDKVSEGQEILKKLLTDGTLERVPSTNYVKLKEGKDMPIDYQKGEYGHIWTVLSQGNMGYHEDDFRPKGNDKIEIRLKRNGYPWHIVGVTPDGMVKEIVIKGGYGQRGSTVVEAAKFAKEQGLVRAGIIDQGTTIRLDVKRGNEWHPYVKTTVDGENPSKASSIIVYAKHRDPAMLSEKQIRILQRAGKLKFMDAIEKAMESGLDPDWRFVQASWMSKMVQYRDRHTGVTWEIDIEDQPMTYEDLFTALEQRAEIIYVKSKDDLETTRTLLLREFQSEKYKTELSEEEFQEVISARRRYRKTQSGYEMIKDPGIVMGYHIGHEDGDQDFQSDLIVFGEWFKDQLGPELSGKFVFNDTDTYHVTTMGFFSLDNDVKKELLPEVRKKIEEFLRAHEERFRQTVKARVIGVDMFLPDGKNGCVIPETLKFKIELDEVGKKFLDEFGRELWEELKKLEDPSLQEIYEHLAYKPGEMEYHITFGSLFDPLSGEEVNRLVDAMKKALDEAQRRNLEYAQPVGRLSGYSNRKKFFYVTEETSGLLSDQAMISDNIGGIDMNRINIDRKGRVIEMEIDPVLMRDILINGVDGFIPVIIDLTPINSVLPLLGLNPEQEIGPANKQEELALFSMN